MPSNNHQDELAQLNSQLTQELTLMETVFEINQQAILIMDQQHHVIRTNPAFTRLTGFQPREMLGKTPHFFNESTACSLSQQIQQALLEHGNWEGEIWDNNKQGDQYLKWLHIQAIKDKQHNIINLIACFTDISEHRANQQKLSYLSSFDSLTSLPNRNTFIKELERATAHSATKQERLAVIVLDLDNFKNIEDMKTGDQLLIQVAERLKSMVRSSDTVARLHGDQFGLILTGMDKKADVATSLVNKVIQLVSSPYQLETCELNITACAGIAIYPEHGMNVSVLVRHTEQALALAKKAGRNQYQFFDAKINADLSGRLHLEKQMREGVANGEFCLYFQPKIETRSGRVSGVEALLRWQHPLLGFVSPATFIPIAEESGFIIELGDWVLKIACQQLRHFQQIGLDNIHIAVNLSAKQFSHQSLPTLLTEYIANNQIDPAMLELELTESVTMADPQNAIEIMNCFRGIGVSLAIDDFGTGYSSLSYLKKFPVSTLKIDRSFVKDIEHDNNDAVICSSTIALAHAMKMKVVAEGVETESQLNYLKRLDCDVIQGFFFSKPLPVDDVIEFIKQRNQQVAKNNQQLQHHRILIIDDDEVSCECINHFLSEAGYATQYLMDPNQALKQITTHPEHFQMIFCDLIMPGMSGIDLITQIRQVNQQLPIVIISSARAEDTRKSLALLEQTHNMIYGKTYMVLEKPLQQENLQQVTEQLMALSQQIA